MCLLVQPSLTGTSPPFGHQGFGPWRHTNISAWTGPPMRVGMSRYLLTAHLLLCSALTVWCKTAFLTSGIRSLAAYLGGGGPGTWVAISGRLARSLPTGPWAPGWGAPKTEGRIHSCRAPWDRFPHCPVSARAATTAHVEGIQCFSGLWGPDRAKQQEEDVWGFSDAPRRG